jgi:hypothetical protein
MPKVRDSSGTIGTTRLPICLSFRSDAEQAHEGHRRGDLAVSALQQRIERPTAPGSAAASPFSRRVREVAAERLAALAQVLHLRRVLGELQEGRSVELVVGDRQVEAVAELPSATSCPSSSAGA